MKKLSIIALLICALCMCTVAVSADVAVDPKMATDEIVSVQVTGTANANDKVTLLAIEGAMDADGAGTEALQRYTESDLEKLLTKVTYLDQKTASDNAASFSFVPRDFEIDNNTIAVYASDGSTTAVKSLNINSVEYAVTFVSEGETCGEVVVIKGANLLKTIDDAGVTAPTRMGYTFAGWTLEGDAEITEEATVTANVTVYAKWNANFLEITTDVGYCTTGEGEDAVKTGVVSVFARPNTAVAKWTQLYIWRGNRGVPSPSDSYSPLWQAGAEVKVSSNDGGFWVITDIPEANFSEGIVVVPRADGAGDGVPQLVRLDGELKYLGDLAALKAEIESQKDSSAQTPFSR